jgi:hypothetical protein
MSFFNHTCKVCGEKYHDCSNCDSWHSAPYRIDGFCSEECAKTTDWVDPWDKGYSLETVWKKLNPDNEYCGEI